MATTQKETRKSVTRTGIVCLTSEVEESRWCGLVHPSIEEALLCNHERMARDERGDGWFYRGTVQERDGLTTLLVDYGSAKELRPELFSLPALCGNDTGSILEGEFRRYGGLRAKLGAEVVVKLAENAERYADTERPWFVPERRAEARAAYRKAVAEVRILRHANRRYVRVHAQIAEVGP